MLSTAENEEASRLQALQEAEENRRKELAALAAREAQEVEAARVRLEEEKALRLEEKRRKLKQAEDEEQARRDAAEKLRLTVEAEKLKKKQKKEAAEAEIRRAKEEREAREAEQRAKEQELELKRVREEEARRVEQEAAERVAAVLAEERRVLAEKEALREKEQEEREEQQRRRELQEREDRERAAVLLERKRQREEAALQAALQQQLDSDAAAKAKFEAEKARAEAEKAIAEAERAKAEAEKAKAEKERPQDDSALSRRKAEILEQAARIRQGEAEDAKQRREQARQQLARQSSLEQQRMQLDAEVTKAEQEAAEKKDAWRAGQMQAEVEAMRKKLEAVEANHREQQERQAGVGRSPAPSLGDCFNEEGSLTASLAGLSLRRLNERARKSQRSISAAQEAPQKQHHHGFLKMHSMPDNDYRYSTFSSADPAERGPRHSVTGGGGVGREGRYSSPSSSPAHRRHSGSAAMSGGASGWGILRSSVLQSGGKYSVNPQQQQQQQSSPTLNGRRRSHSSSTGEGSDYVGQFRSRKSVSMSLPTTPGPSSSVGALSGTSSPRPSNRLLTKTSTVGYTPEPPSVGMLTPPAPSPLSLVFTPGEFSDSQSESGCETEPSTPASPALSSPGRFGTAVSSQDIQLEVNSPDRRAPSGTDAVEQMDDQRIEMNGLDSGDRDMEIAPVDTEADTEADAATRLAAKKKAEAERVRAKRQAEARMFEKRKNAAEAVAVQDHKKLQSEVVSILSMEKGLERTSSGRSRGEGEEEASRVRTAQVVIDSALQERDGGLVRDRGRREANGDSETDNVPRKEERMTEMVLDGSEMNAGEEEWCAPSGTGEESKTDSDKDRPPMAPRAKSLLLGDISIRPLPLQGKHSNSSSSSRGSSGSSTLLKVEVEKTVLDLDSEASLVSSVDSGDEILLSTPAELDPALGMKMAVNASPTKKRFSSHHSEVDSPGSGHREKKYSPMGSGGGGSCMTDEERRRHFQNGGSNSRSNSSVRSLSSMNHVHSNSAARLGDLVISQEEGDGVFQLHSMEDFDDILGEWIGDQEKLELRQSYPEDHLDTESSLDNYIVKTLRRSSEIDWRLGQLETKMPHPEGIMDIRQILLAKMETLRLLRDRRSGADGGGDLLSTKRLDELRDELHGLRTRCLEAVDRERVRLKDPEHVLQEELDMIANL